MRLNVFISSFPFIWYGTQSFENVNVSIGTVNMEADMGIYCWYQHKSKPSFCLYNVGVHFTNEWIRMDSNGFEWRQLHVSMHLSHLLHLQLFPFKCSTFSTTRIFMYSLMNHKLKKYNNSWAELYHRVIHFDTSNKFEWNTIQKISTAQIQRVFFEKKDMFSLFFSKVKWNPLPKCQIKPFVMLIY